MPVLKEVGPVDTGVVRRVDWVPPEAEVEVPVCGTEVVVAVLGGTTVPSVAVVVGTDDPTEAGEAGRLSISNVSNLPVSSCCSIKSGNRAQTAFLEAFNSHSRPA